MSMFAAKVDEVGRGPDSNRYQQGTCDRATDDFGFVEMQTKTVGFPDIVRIARALGCDQEGRDFLSAEDRPQIGPCPPNADAIARNE